MRTHRSSLNLSKWQSPQKNSRISLRTPQKNIFQAKQSSLATNPQQHLQATSHQLQHQSMIRNGVPAHTRAYVWTQLIPNHAEVLYEQYTLLKRNLLIKEAQGFHITTENNKNNENFIKKIRNQQQNQENVSLQKKNFDRGLLRVLSIIRLDIPQAITMLQIRGYSAQLQQQLFAVVGTFMQLRQQIGYRMGLMMIGGVLLTALGSDYRAFAALLSIVTCTPLYSFFTDYSQATQQFYSKLMMTMKQKDPVLHSCLSSLQIKKVIVIWVCGLFSNCLRRHALLQVWDLLWLQGGKVSVIMQISISLLTLRRNQILMYSKNPRQLYMYLIQSKLDAEQQQKLLDSLRKKAICSQFHKF